MNINVYPADDNIHVSLDIFLDPGDYDDDLSCPLQADITATLLNQLEDKNHFSRTIPIAFIGSKDYEECPTFIRRSKLHLDPVKKNKVPQERYFVFQGDSQREK